MAEYKKKNVGRFKKKIKNSVTDEIPMKKARTTSKNATQKAPKVKKEVSRPKFVPQERASNNMKVVRGNKFRIKRKRLLILGAISAVLLFVIIFAACTPTSMGEFLSNRFALVGKGGYPISISNESTFISVEQGNDFYVTVNAGTIDGYSNKGKKIFTYPHGFEFPVVTQSAERFLVYSLGETQFSIHNLNKKLYSGTTDNNILACAISDNGTYAIATQSNSYSSQVIVYNKKNKRLFTWNCADYIINNVALSPNGKRLAVSVFNTRSGKYLSKLYVFEYDSADPINVFEYEDDMIMSLKNAGKSSFYAVFESKITFYKWKNLSNSSISGDKKVFFARNNKKHTIIATGNEANKSDNEIYVLTGKGVEKCKFNFNEEIIDIALRKNYVYILSDRVIYIYNVKGTLVKTLACDFGVKRIIPVGKFSVLTITDNNIKKISG